MAVIEYDDQFKAEEVRLSLMKLQKEYLIDLEDAVVAVKDQKGKVRLHQAWMTDCQCPRKFGYSAVLTVGQG